MSELVPSIKSVTICNHLCALVICRAAKGGKWVVKACLMARCHW